MNRFMLVALFAPAIIGLSAANACDDEKIAPLLEDEKMTEILSCSGDLCTMTKILACHQLGFAISPDCLNVSSVI